MAVPLGVHNERLELVGSVPTDIELVWVTWRSFRKSHTKSPQRCSKSRTDGQGKLTKWAPPVPLKRGQNPKHPSQARRFSNNRLLGIILRPLRCCTKSCWITPFGILLAFQSSQNSRIPRKLAIDLGARIPNPTQLVAVMRAACSQNINRYTNCSTRLSQQNRHRCPCQNVNLLKMTFSSCFLSSTHQPFGMHEERDRCHLHSNFWSMVIGESDSTGGHTSRYVIHRKIFREKLGLLVHLL